MTATPPRRTPLVTRRDIEVKDDADIRAMIDDQVIRFLGERYSSQVIADYMGVSGSKIRKLLRPENRSENS